MSDIGKKVLSALPVVEQIAGIALTVAKLFPPTASIANAIEMGIKVEQGIRSEVPEIIQTYNDMKAAAAGGVEVTAVQWAAWDQQIADAHSGFLAAAAAVENQA